MSVLIKGMKMPKDCWNCPLLNSEPCPCKGYSTALEHVMNRHEHCPLVEIPPHGDLIDAEEQMRLMQSSEYDTYDDYNRAFDMLDNATAVIPREKAEEGDK